MKSLVLAEKPSVGKAIASVLKCGKSTKGYIEGPGFVVTWAMGHLVELADPDYYDPSLKEWKMEKLPIIPSEMKFRVIKKSGRQFNTVKQLMKRGDIGKVIIATDAGREGELVARLIMKLSSWKGPYERLWISSQTDSAVKEGFSNLKPGRDYDNLYRAALCRAEADWIVGINATRALSCRYDVRLSAGRVQTPAVNLIVSREQEIEKFLSRKFWTLEADFGGFSGQAMKSEGSLRFYDYDEALKASGKLKTMEARVVSVVKKVKPVPPPKAYDLTLLQREANQKYGFSAKKTLNTLQVLYERHKIATYPRTDSSFLPSDIVPTLNKRVKSLENTVYSKYAKNLLASGIHTGKNIINDSKVNDHHAIIPTGERIIAERLSSDELIIMNMVSERFLEVLSKPESIEQVTALIGAGDIQFRIKAGRQIEKGWRSVASGMSDTGGTASEYEEITGLAEGSCLVISGVKIKEGSISPPDRYTEASLLGVMENPSSLVSDNKLKKAISRGGLGTPATRADIIEKIIANGYIERDGRYLKPTSRGIELMEVVPEEFKSPVLTAKWEQRLTNIAEGHESPGDFLKEIRVKAKEVVSEIKNSKQEYKPRDTSGKKCPMCGRVLIPSRDRRGHKIFVCHSLSCGYEESSLEREDLPRQAGRKERAMNRRLISKYSDNSEATATFGDFIKASMEKNTKN